ncbi:MAG TPA: histidine kinase [Bryobacteraceae bacterium]
MLWLNAAARAAFGNPGNLVDAIRSRSSEFSLVMETNETVLMGAQLTHLAHRVGREEAHLLLDLQDNMMRNCFRLQAAERSLSTRARQMKPGGGSRAILQIERERERLGRELHTGVGQMLVAIRTQLEVIQTVFPDPPPSVQEALARISSLASDALEQVRSVARKLHPPEWLRLTLETALEQLWQLSGIAARYQASLQLTTLPHEPDLEVKILMYRAAQEALSNLMQHAHATSVTLTLELRGEQLVLRIEDNGVGFDANRELSAPANVASGIGLRSIREQAASLGGKCVIDSGSGGTTLEVAVPFLPEAQ